jgi:hypothetical protein
MISVHRNAKWLASYSNGFHATRVGIELTHEADIEFVA